jgi:hypothetical protein
MDKFLKKLDTTAGIESEKKLAVWLERLAFVFLILMTLTAPHSIAASQTSYILGMIFWIARFFLTPRPKFIRTAFFIPFLAFGLWAIISAVFSYAPDISLDKLRNVLLFLIFFFVINNLRTVRAVKFIAIALIVSCMVSVIWTPIERAIGRGIEIHNVRADSPLVKAKMLEGDTLLRADGQKISTPEDLIARFADKEKVEIQIYRPDFYLVIPIKKSDLLDGKTAGEKLGFASWKRSRNWRSAGFYGHYATFAEVLQLIASLTFGLFIAGIASRRGREGKRESWVSRPLAPSLNPALSPSLLLFFTAVGLMAFALLLTVTRASQAAFMASAFSIVLVGASRKMFLILLAIAIPVMIGGLIFLQQARDTKFFDPNDNSTTWRQTVYREGFELWTKNTRHFILGVGMDSIKRYKDEWGLFDNGRLPPGHFHSTPLQLVVERGLPALLLWLLILGIYTLKMFKALRQNNFKDWIEKGIVLGAFGGTIGFFISGLVHYNLGDGEVAMVFFLIMALAVRLNQLRIKN